VKPTQSYQGFSVVPENAQPCHLARCRQNTAFWPLKRKPVAAQNEQTMAEINHKRPESSLSTGFIRAALHINTRSKIELSRLASSFDEIW
jgi:hypothetical protein